MMPKRIKPAYKDSRITLYRGDALRVMAQIKCDHVIGDLPYEERMHKAKAKPRRVRTDHGPDLRALKFASVDKLRDPLIPLVKASCSGWLIVFCTPEGIAPWRDAIEAGGLRYKRACFWCKPDGAPQFNGQGPAYSVEPFVTAWCGKGVSRWSGGGRKNWWEVRTNNPDRESTHETEKPIELMMQIITAFTKPGDVICDPCMGSGTTILAALATGRRGIGIEKDARTFKLARARIDAEFKLMGRAESRRYITKKLGLVEATAGPLFGGMQV